jgi:hypothetical protein
MARVFLTMNVLYKSKHAHISVRLPSSIARTILTVEVTSTASVYQEEMQSSLVALRNGEEKIMFTKAGAEIEEVEGMHVTTDRGKMQSMKADAVDSAPLELTSAEERRLYRKIDLRLMPILTLMELCSFLDRGTNSLNEPPAHCT